MKFDKLLENSPSLKEVTRFMYTLQDTLLEAYPNFKTKIIPIQHSLEMPLSILWKLADHTILVSTEKETLINPTNQKITLWFRNKGDITRISHVNLNFSAFTAEEIHFDLIPPITKLSLFHSDFIAKHLQLANDGKITKLQKFFIID